MEFKERCPWALTCPSMTNYHDMQWGVPTYDDHIFFEFLILESAQAGLSWQTILNKREGYRNAFENFDIQKVANFTNHDIESLLTNFNIIKNRKKIEASITNAQHFIEIQNHYKSFSHYIWGFVNNSPINHSFTNQAEIPLYIQESNELHKDLKKRGFQFFGPIITYSFMQAIGLINDHSINCFFKIRYITLEEAL